jgi:Flp pilus assembly pilin Flp
MLEYLFAAFSRMFGEEKGQTAVEYGLVILLVALVLAGILATGMTSVINTIVQNIKDAL